MLQAIPHKGNHTIEEVNEEAKKRRWKENPEKTWSSKKKCLTPKMKDGGFKFLDRRDMNPELKLHVESKDPDQEDKS
jgi:hypothetical protein